MRRHLLFFLAVLSLSLIAFVPKIYSSIPPHPRVKQMMKDGTLPVPYHILHREEAVKRGINAPFARVSKAEGRRASLHTSGSTSTLRALAILVRFTDNPSQVPALFFDSLLYGSTGRTVRNYYNECSYGTVDVVTVDFPSATDWRAMPQLYSYYTDGQNGFGAYPRNSQKLAEDAVAAVDNSVDFSNYDNDGDGYVDALFIIHAGQGAEFTGNPNHIWSHAWAMSAPKSVDGVYAYRYSVEPEYWLSGGDMTCGVYAHEMGHAVFGLGDLYDYGYDSEGLGSWSLMAGGSWNGANGNSPAHPDAFSRIEMGFLSATEIHRDTFAVDIPPVKETGVIYKLWKDGSGTSEYFLVENRQRIGYDAALPASGLCIYHVDETQGNNNNQWYPGYTNYGNYRVALEQADGRWDLERNQGRGDGGDPYPGSAVNRIFNNSSMPDSKNYAIEPTDVAVRNISDSRPVMNADFIVEALPPEIDIEPVSFTLSVNSGDTVRRTLTVRNAGPGLLDFEIPLATLWSFRNQPVIPEGFDDKKQTRGINETGGPDEFGYIWIDSDQPGGPVFDWVDIADKGTPLTLSDDGSSGFVPLGFDFSFYGRLFSQVNICANGWISFSSGGSVLPISPLPSFWSPSDLISIMGADMYPTGSCYYFSDLANERFIVEYYNWGLFGTYSPDYTMEIILYKDGRVLLQYLRMDGNVTGYVTGMQNGSRDIGQMVKFQETYLRDSLAVEFHLLPRWLSVEPSGGSLLPGEEAAISLIFDSYRLMPGVQTGTLIVTSNDLDENSISVPVSMDVLNQPSISVSPPSLDLDTLYVGHTRIETLTVRNRGCSELSIDHIDPGDTVVGFDRTSFSVMPWSDERLVLTIKADSAGVLSSDIGFSSNDPNDPMFLVPVSGRVLHRPEIAVTPDSLFFAIDRGSEETSSMTIFNQGLGELLYDVSAFSNDYVVGDSVIRATWTSCLRGNIVTVDEESALESFDIFLDVPSPLVLSFALYQSDSKSGTFQRIFLAQSAVEGGCRFYSSGRISATLRPDKYYFLGVSNSGSVTYYRKTLATPFDTEFGTVHSGVSSGDYPPPETLVPNLYPSYIWYQKVSLRPKMIDADFPITGMLGPNSQVEIPFTIRSILPYGTYESGFTVRHNDPFAGEQNIFFALEVGYPGFDVGEGWNLVSVPVKVEDNRKSTVFPTSPVSAFGFKNGYLEQDTLEHGLGYWLKFPEQSRITMNGEICQDDTFFIEDQWNIIGSVTYPVPVGRISFLSNGSLNSYFYGYSAEFGYSRADTLEPGNGYWVKASEPGALVLQGDISSSLEKRSHGGSPEDRTDGTTGNSATAFNVSTLTFIDHLGRTRVLYVGPGGNTDIDPGLSSLPPVPPEGAFDVRFGSQRNAETVAESGQDFAIQLSCAVFPLVIQWNIDDHYARSILSGGGEKIILTGEGVKQISEEVSTMILQIGQGTELPIVFDLKQNSPNPFNPSTRIEYQLPVESLVKLSVFDMLGRDVQTLIDGIQDAGYKSVEWNSANISGTPIASGLYFYRLDAVGISDPSQSFTRVKKMMLIK